MLVSNLMLPISSYKGYRPKRINLWNCFWYDPYQENNTPPPSLSPTNTRYETQAYTHFHYAKRKYDRRLVDASNKLGDTIEKKEFELLECFVTMMYATLNLYSISYEMLYNLGPMQAELTEWIKVVCGYHLSSLAFTHIFLVCAETRTNHHHAKEARGKTRTAAEEGRTRQVPPSRKGEVLPPPPNIDLCLTHQFN